MAAVSDYESLISSYVEPWAKSSDCFPKGAEAGQLVLKAFEAQKAFLSKAIGMKKPGQGEVQELLAKTTEGVEALSDLHEGNSREPTAKNTQMLQEGIQVLAWVTVDKTPVPFINETISSCMFYGNKVLTENKGKDEKQVQWVKDFKQIMEELGKYVKQHHTTGVAWASSAGGVTEEEDSSAPSGGNSVQAYDEFLKTVPPLVKSSAKLSAELADAAAKLEEAFSVQREFLVAVETHSKPADDVFMAALQPQIDKMGEVGEAVQNVRDRDLTNHAKAVEEGAQLLAWVSVPTTVPHVAEQAVQVQFYINKLLMAHKGKEEHKEWSAHYKAVLEGLQDYVKAEHKTGLAWKAGASAMTAAAVPAAPKAEKKNVVKATASSDDSRSALFSELSKGTDISKGLKKVSDAEKTHKNRTGEVKPIDEEALERKKAQAASAAKKRNAFPTGEPKMALEGKKWMVEYQTGTRLEMKQLEIEVDKSHSVYMYGCQNAFVKIVGKVNAITIDKCKKVQVMFENCICSLEVTSCEGAEVQVTGELRAASIDKSTEVMLYLSRESMDIEITSSACTCLNVTVPGKTDEDDTVEMNIPEQFVSHIRGNKIETAPMDHAG